MFIEFSCGASFAQNAAMHDRNAVADTQQLRQITRDHQNCFPARGELPPVSLTWYQGGERPATLSYLKLGGWSNGVLFVGEKGMLVADYGRKKLLPEETFRDFKAPDPSIPPSIGHHAEWIAACKDARPTTCNFDYSGALTESILRKLDGLMQQYVNHHHRLPEVAPFIPAAATTNTAAGTAAPATVRAKLTTGFRIEGLSRCRDLPSTTR